MNAKIQLNTLKSYSAIIVPFQWDYLLSNEAKKPEDFVNYLCSLEFFSPKGELQKLWKKNTKLPNGVEELKPSFQSLFDEEINDSPWLWKICTLKKKTLNFLFSNPKIFKGKGKGNPISDFSIIEINVIIFPLGIGVMNFQINWIPNKDQNKSEFFSVDEIIDRLSRIKYMRFSGNMGCGWIFSHNLTIAQRAQDSSFRRARSKKGG